MLFIGFRSEFNTIIHQQLILKLRSAEDQHLLVQLAAGLSSEHKQFGLATTQGCVLNTLLFTLLTHNCKRTSSSNLLGSWRTVVGLINNNDETIYRRGVNRLTMLRKYYNLQLIVENTKEIVVGFRRVQTQHAPPINSKAVEQVSSTKFLVVYITQDLTWNINLLSLAKNPNSDYTLSQSINFYLYSTKSHLQLMNFLRKNCKSSGRYHAHFLRRYH